MVESRTKALKLYNEMKLKYKLPSLKELEEEFDFELDETSGIASYILNRIWDRVMKIKNDLEGIFQPQQYCCLIEHKFFTDKEKKELFNTYSEIMTNYWEAVRTTYLSREDKIKMIKKSYDYYLKLKPKAVNYINKMISKWDKKSEQETSEAYIN